MSKRYAAVLARLVRTATGFHRSERAERNRMLVRDLLVTRHVIDTARGPLALICKDKGEVHYAHHFFDREPDALNWIDGFEGPCTFWDVGANTGIYALYAALAKGVTVYAFEPSANSHAQLYTNIWANGMDDRVHGLCIGFYSETLLAELHMGAVDAGSALHEFTATSAATGARPAPGQHLQHVPTYTIDDFRRAFGLDAPDYLKIDVDGVEEDILAGAAATLGDPRLRSILLELAIHDVALNEKFRSVLGKHGFSPEPVPDGADNVVFRR